jgi:hypothetical protein
MEHRWGRRKVVRVPVRLIGETGDATGQTDNVSISGAFIRTARATALWTRLEVEFPHPHGPSEEPERIAAHVTRRTRDGVGVEWDELAPHAVRALLLDGEPRLPAQARQDTRRLIRPTVELHAQVLSRIDIGPSWPRIL